MTHPLESFILSYLNTEDIPWENVEPQVYDVLLSHELSTLLAHGSQTDLTRFCFDPEALPEHSGSQFLALGDPALDSLFQHVMAVGRSAIVYLPESNCSPQNLEAAIKRELLTPDLSLACGTPKPLYFSKALFCFQITHLCDEKQQLLLSVGVDLHFGRIARNLETLLDSSGIVSSRPLPYPDASSLSHEEGYTIAWNECSRKATASAAMLKQKLQTAFSEESQRLKNYFDELKKELIVRQEKAKAEDLSRFHQQLHSIDLEERARFVDLQKKNSLQTEINLVNVLWIEQLQILIPITILHRGKSISAEVVWDPKTQRVEPLACPNCQAPTLQLTACRQKGVGCPQCC